MYQSGLSRIFFAVFSLIVVIFPFKLPVLVDCCLTMNNYYHLQETNAWSQSNCSLTSWTFSTKGWLCPTEWSSCASSGEPLLHHRPDRQGLSSPRWSGRLKKTYADGTSRSTFCKKTVMSLKDSLKKIPAIPVEKPEVKKKKEKRSTGADGESKSKKWPKKNHKIKSRTTRAHNYQKPHHLFQCN